MEEEEDEDDDDTQNNGRYPRETWAMFTTDHKLPCRDHEIEVNPLNYRPTICR